MAESEKTSRITGLQQLTKKFTTPDGRNELDNDNVGMIVTSLKDFDDIDIITEAFRAVRNACAGCEKNQILIGQESEFAGVAVQRMKFLLGIEHSNETLLAIGCGLQALGNLVTGCEVNKGSVAVKLWHDFGTLLNVENEKVRNYTSMVLYNCLSDEVTNRIISTDDGKLISRRILQIATEFDNMEWPMYLAQHLVKNELFLPSIFEGLDSTRKLFLLDLISEHIQQVSVPTKTLDSVPTKTLDYVSGQFVDCAHSILSTSQKSSVSVSEPVISTRMLDVLVNASSTDHYRGHLASNQQLLEGSINLLHGIHLIGKTDENAFTTASKPGDEPDRDHPAFGLRKDLVRLIGNLCFKNRENQNLTRDLGGVQLVMEQSSVDGKNPYITQWSVLAIRNLCEGNDENQRLIAEMRMEGVSNRVEVLRDYGVDAYEEDGKVKVRRPADE